MLEDGPPPRRKAVPQLGVQVGIAAGLLVLIAWLFFNMMANIGLLGGTFGFSFLLRPGGFEIGESLIAYSAKSTYLRAIVVGFANTVQLAALGCAGSLVAGFLVALLRANATKPLAILMQAYVEIVRNTPLLLQLFIWSTLVKALPPVRQALEPLPGFLVSNRGFNFPLPSDRWTGVLAAVGVLLLLMSVRARFATKGRIAGVIRLHHVFAVGAAMLIVLVLSRPFSVPVRRGFNVQGGGSVSPEFLCMIMGIIVYHAALVGEIVRAGFNSVPAGQYEAGRALSLSTSLILVKIIVPQALRLIILPITALFQGLAKSTSLAVAIGFPEFLTVINTVTGQTGQPIEMAAILVFGYFCLSFVIAQIGNSLDRLVRIKES